MELLRRMVIDVLLLVIVFFRVMQGDKTLWSFWWSYHGISGPDYWGMVNFEWGLCSKGRYQSPVDINPRTLLYDPNLRPVRLDQHRVDGHLINTGNDITFQVAPKTEKSFLLAGGPLSYTYKVHFIKLHFGRVDQIGSEHTVGGRPFPVEIQLLAYNDIYHNYTEASRKAHGLAAVAIFGSIGETSNAEFHTLVHATSQITQTGQNLSISGLSILNLLPETRDYMTYEGSLTQPSCYESVSWIVFNKPIYVTKDDLLRLRELTESKEGQSTDSILQENNFRPTMPLNRRTIRTNIAPKQKDTNCGVKKITFYEVNDRYRVT
ncbi:carbonic anhydrase-related protein 10-like [Littorina saxatilis]|uniref:carbonic anhydrase-related protein 10-like n=1 Tax=Littorina saxatilis TaxID=31220 RepID=UPI0038B69A33